MYDQTSKGLDFLIWEISIETDDLLDGGGGPQWTAAIEGLHSTLDFGRWNNVQDGLKNTAAVP